MMMKAIKKIQGLAAVGLFACFLFTACPMTEETGNDGLPDPVFKTKNGRYLTSTLVDITCADQDAVIYYTINSEAAPDSSSSEFKSSSKIKLEFEELGVEEIIVKAIAEKQGKYSKVVTGTFTRLDIGIADLTTPMQALAADILAAPGGTSADDPYRLRIPASITLEDVKLDMPRPDIPNVNITDGLGALFVAFQGKYISLDLSDVSWKGPDPYGAVTGDVQKVPACNQAAWELRPDREKLVEVIFPKDIVIVEIHAFHGCEGIKKLDFSNCNQLRVLDEYAFTDNKSLEILDLSGCTELRQLEQYVFSRPEKLKYLDLSDTQVDNIGKWGFQHCYSLEWIEFPETLREMHDYCFQRPSNLKYVRFRGEKWRPIFNWCNFLYYMDESSFNGREVTHRVQQPENNVRDATDQNFVIFSPDTPYWDSGEDNLFYFNTGASYHHSQHVTLPKKGDSITTPGGTFSYASLDVLRGDELLRAAEPFRGLSTLDFNFQGIKDTGGNLVDGTVTVSALSGVQDPPSTAAAGQFDAFKRVTLSTVPMTNGNAVVHVGSPDDTALNVLNNFNAQQLTGRYDRAGTQSEAEKWMNKTNLTYDGYVTGNGVSGYDTEPSIWPQNTVKFAVLELGVQKSDGTTGYLQQQGESVLRLDGRVYDYRTVRYVWVSEDCTVYRRNRGGSNAGGPAGWDGFSTNVYMTLKRGWNLWDVQKQYLLGDLYTGSRDQDQLKAALEPLLGTDTQPGLRIRNLIGTGKQPYQNPKLEMDDLGKPQNYNPGAPYGNPVQWKSIPWIFTAEPYKYPD